MTAISHGVKGTSAGRLRSGSRKQRHRRLQLLVVRPGSSAATSAHRLLPYCCTSWHSRSSSCAHRRGGGGGLSWACFVVVESNCEHQRAAGAAAAATTGRARRGDMRSAPPAARWQAAPQVSPLCSKQLEAGMRRPAGSWATASCVMLQGVLTRLSASRPCFKVRDLSYDSKCYICSYSWCGRCFALLDCACRLQSQTRACLGQSTRSNAVLCTLRRSCER
jgi:hypothetical protein